MQNGTVGGLLSNQCRRYMPSGELNDGLYDAPPKIQSEQLQESDQARLRQLANVFIDMFLASRSSNDELPKEWVN